MQQCLQSSGHETDHTRRLGVGRSGGAATRCSTGWWRGAGRATGSRARHQTGGAEVLARCGWASGCSAGERLKRKSCGCGREID